MHLSALRPRHWGAASVFALTAALVSGAAPALHASQLFQAIEVDQSRFVIVAVPIGSSGTKAQLQIYEQVDPKRRPCYQVLSGSPATVLPLLGTFDFTGICRRFIDSQGYSARVGGDDLGSTYRFVVRKTANDNLLVATPAGGGSGKPEMLVARTQGTGGPSAFLEFKFEPGWRVMRRAYGGRALGHVYLYRDSWQSAAPGQPAAASMPAPVSAPPAPQPKPSSPLSRNR